MEKEPMCAGRQAKRVQKLVSSASPPVCGALATGRRIKASELLHNFTLHQTKHRHSARLSTPPGACDHDPYSGAKNNTCTILGTALGAVQKNEFNFVNLCSHADDFQALADPADVFFGGGRFEKVWSTDHNRGRLLLTFL